MHISRATILQMVYLIPTCYTMRNALFWGIARRRVVVIPGFFGMKKVKTHVWTQQITSLSTLYDFILYKLILKILIFQF